MPPAPVNTETTPAWNPEAPRRIVFIAADDRQTGTYFRYHNLARALRHLGHEVTVVTQSATCRWKPRPEIRDGVPYLIQPSVPGNRLLLPATNPINAVRRNLRGIPSADTYHLFQPFPTGVSLWRRLHRSHPEALFAYDWDDYWINDFFGLKQPRGLDKRWAAYRLRQLERQLPAECDLLTPISRPLLRLGKRYGCATTYLLYNGVWPEPPPDRAAARAQFGIDPSAPVLGVMGWGVLFDLIFAAFESLADQFPHAQLLMCGADPGPLLAQFPKTQARSRYLGVLAPEKLPQFKAALDLGLLPLRNDDFDRYRTPYKLTDFLAAGVPVACTRVGETGLLADELPGLFAGEPSLEGFTAVLREALANLTAAPGSLRVDTATILDRFHWESIARGLTCAYAKAAALKATCAA